MCDIQLINEIIVIVFVLDESIMTFNHTNNSHIHMLSLALGSRIVVEQRHQLRKRVMLGRDER